MLDIHVSDGHGHDLAFTRKLIQGQPTLEDVRLTDPLPAGSDAILTLTYPAAAADTYTTSVQAFALEEDPNPADNTADASTKVVAEAVTLANSVDGQDVTLTAASGTYLVDAAAVSNPSPTDAPVGVTFPVGFFRFAVAGVALGGSTAVTITLPSGFVITDYYKYGPTPDNLLPHWYRFAFDAHHGCGDSWQCNHSSPDRRPAWR